MKIICTICSKSKNEDQDFLPAQLRYTAPHIQTTEKIALKLKLPFFILSGKYGLISADEMISNYDYYLEDSKVDNLVQIVSKQIRKEEITEIDFYIENKASWIPYRKVMDLAVQQSKIILHTREFDC